MENIRNFIVSVGNANLSYAMIDTGNKNIIYDKMTILTNFQSTFYLQIKILGNKSIAYNIITEISNVFINICRKYRFSSDSISIVGKGHKEVPIANFIFNIGHAGIFISIHGTSNKII